MKRATTCNDDFCITFVITVKTVSSESSARARIVMSAALDGIPVYTNMTCVEGVGGIYWPVPRESPGLNAGLTLGANSVLGDPGSEGRKTISSQSNLKAIIVTTRASTSICGVMVCYGQGIYMVVSELATKVRLTGFATYVGWISKVAGFGLCNVQGHSELVEVNTRPSRGMACPS